MMSAIKNRLHRILTKMYLAWGQRLLRKQLPRTPEPIQKIEDPLTIEEYDKDASQGGLALLHQVMAERLLQIAPKQGRALDISSGTAHFVLNLAEQLSEMIFICTDISEPMIDQARKNAKARGLSNVQFIMKSWHELEDFPEKSFDLITWSLGAHHCRDEQEVQKVLQSCRKLLQNNGTLFVLDPVRPATQHLAKTLTDYSSAKWGKGAYYREVLDSYHASFSYREFSKIIKNSGFNNLRHYQPPFFNFWQVIYQMGHPPQKRIRPEDSPTLKEHKSDLNFLRLLFSPMYFRHGIQK